MIETCPYIGLRPELDPLPERIKALPVDKRGYPVPWFVPTVNGEPEFRAASRERHTQALKEARCWVCGGKLGARACFVVGPMCGINRNTAEPPSHTECARWSVRNCPFLSRPHMVRREDELINRNNFTAPGKAILRNPGVTLLWVTKAYEVDWRLALITMGEPEQTEWWFARRPATYGEVVESIRTGLPFLEQEANESKTHKQEMLREIAKGLAFIEKRLPSLVAI